MNIDELKLRGGTTDQLHQTYMELKKGESKSFEVVLIVPDLLDQKSYDLTVDTKSFDVKNLEYKSAGKASIIVAIKQDYFTVSKTIQDPHISQGYHNGQVNQSEIVVLYDMNDIVLMDEHQSKF